MIRISGILAVTGLQVQRNAKNTYARHREYCQFPGRFVVCTVGVTEPVKLLCWSVYRLRRSTPPQYSEPFPVQRLEQSAGAVGTAPPLMVSPQPSRITVSGQQIGATDSTYGTRHRFPLRQDCNPGRSKHRCNLEHCCYNHHQGRLFVERASSLTGCH